MIVVRRSDQTLELITQLGHAAVAGALAERWGAGRFAAPRFQNALVIAAHHHDDGWVELESEPYFNLGAGRPAHFTEVPLTDSVGPYGRGVESVYARDPLAGALCSMHWSGFSTSRWGAGGDRQNADPLAQQVIAGAEARWMPALREAWGNRGRRSAFDAGVWFAYELLQAVDLLSLGLGLLDTDAPGDGGEPATVSSTLARVEQGGQARLIDCVPLRVGGEVVTLTLAPLGSGRVSLDPYPLSGGELALEIPARRIPDRRYESAEAAGRTWHSAPPAARRVTLVGPEN
jgi:hypothetical protein